MADKVRPIGSGRANTNTKNQSSYSITFAEGHEAARGKWTGIVAYLGVQLPHGENHRKHAPCPGCGGRDRFRVMADFAEHGRWYCGGGGSPEYGDGFGLLCHVLGYTSGDALRAVADYLGLNQQSEEERKRRQRIAEQRQAERAKQAAFKTERARVLYNIESQFLAIKRICKETDSDYLWPVAAQVEAAKLQDYIGVEFSRTECCK